MDLKSLLLTNAAAVAAAVLLLWLISVLRRDASIVDIFWGLGFALIACLSLYHSRPASSRSVALTAMVCVWAVRLASYLAWRNLGKPEDYRYAAMREKHGRRFPLVSLVTVFLLQGTLMWVISLPVQIGIARAASWSWVARLGVAVWAVGLFFEAVGDYQMARFKADSSQRGRVMNRGLWRYTRHPNYFGDFLVWWGFYFVAAEPQTWWWTIASPLLMSYFLIRVSGVRLLESSLRSRLEGYEEYVRGTSAFFPLPPRLTTEQSD